MRFTLLAILTCLINFSFAQFKSGFTPEEAKVLSALCSTYTYKRVMQSDKELIPEGYQKVFESEVVGMDNLFQVYENGTTGVINFRGTISTFSSWLENTYSAMIPIKGKMKINRKKTWYQFAEKKGAAVHAGYGLSVVLLSPVLLQQIKALNEKNIYQIYLTGHSQGGALAHLFRASVPYLPEGSISPKNSFKVYAFANPKCGNKEFSEEYNRLYSSNGMSFSVINPSDLIPRLPLHYGEDGALSYKKIKGVIQGKEDLESVLRMGKNYALHKIERKVKRYSRITNKIIEKIVSKNNVKIKMPKYVKDINYYQVGTVELLETFPYPENRIVQQPRENKKILGIRLGKEKMKQKLKQSIFQHRSYNYHVAILRKYFQADYKALERHYLPSEI